MILAPGTRLGPYEVLSPLGAGGMGEVYRARDTRLDRLVAVKVLPPGAADDRSFQDRFQREARTISSLSHPNICALFDIGEQDGRPFLVMEYLAGQTLAERLAAGPPPIADALAWAVQIADGMARAHAAGIVHRDLKPGNIMLVDDGPVKILDFGLAKQFAAGSEDATALHATEMGITSGTVAYMSPEQALGERIDHRSDIFSFGVLLYELFGGTRPFTGRNAFSVMHQILHDEPKPLPRALPSVPEPLGRLIARMLAKAPDERPQMMLEVGQWLRTIARGDSEAMPEGASARRAPASVATSPSWFRWAPGRRPTGRSWAAAGLVLLIAAAAAATLVPSIRDRGLDAFRTPSPSDAAGADAGTPTTAFEWTTRGRALLQRFDRLGNVDGALDACQRAVALEPENAFAHTCLAEALVRKDRLTPDPQWMRQATEAAQRSVDLNPDLAAAHVALGLVRLRSSQLDDGRAAFGRAIDLDPLAAKAYVGIGEYHQARGEARQAEAAYREAARLAPDDWHALTQVGHVLYEQARYEEAAGTWERAREVTPDNPVVLRNLGAVYHMLERTDQAASALQRALEIQPSATVYSNLGTLRFFQGRYTDASAAFEKAVELNPTYFLYWANLGDARRWLPGQTTQAGEAYGRAVALVEDDLRANALDPDRRTQLALYLAKSGQPERAAEELRQWESAGNPTPASHFRAAVVHEIGGRRDAALKALQEALGAGYAPGEIQGEPELVNLRADVRYHRMLADHQTRGRTGKAAIK
jgi:eukaryotic-like serine/threonine-protein kinase